MRDFQLWTFIPIATEYIGTLGESLTIYYCTDDWLHAAGYDGTKLRAMEQQLCARSDLVFATAKPLQAIFNSVNPETHLARHGVNHSHFAKALMPTTRIAPELDGTQRPILGVIGFIDERVDLELLEKLAGSNPELSIVIIGRTHVDVSKLEKYANIKFLGRKPYDRLPEFCKGFSVGLIPFKVNEFTRHVNPIKLREYLSAGLPVVSTNLPEVGIYRSLCTVASTHDEFIQGVRAALKDNSPEARTRRSQAMRQETWEQKVEELSVHVMRVKELKGRSK
jgi:glycosyltransferase involved in cell wall biosynthesis